MKVWNTKAHHIIKLEFREDQVKAQIQNKHAESKFNMGPALLPRVNEMIERRGDGKFVREWLIN